MEDVVKHCDHIHVQNTVRDTVRMTVLTQNRKYKIYLNNKTHHTIPQRLTINNSIKLEF